MNRAYFGMGFYHPCDTCHPREGGDLVQVGKDCLVSPVRHPDDAKHPSGSIRQKALVLVYALLNRPTAKSKPIHKILLSIMMLLMWTPVFASNLVNLQFQNAPVKEVISMLGEVANHNIVIDQGITQKITISLHNMPWQKALDQVLKAENLVSKNEHGVIYVSTEQSLLQQLKSQQSYQKNKQSLESLNIKAIAIQYGKANAFENMIRASHLLSRRASLTVDAAKNALILDGTKQDIQKMQAFIKKLDKPAPQILIKARIVQVDTQAMKALGVHFLNIGAGDKVSIKGHTKTIVQNALGALGLSVGELPGGMMLDMTLQALETQGKGEVVSAPHLLVSNNQSALIEQGTEVPYASDNGNGAFQIQFKKAVMGLTVTPRVINSKTVMLKLKVSKDAVSKVFLASAKHEPLINTQYIQTEVRVENNQTIVLGGIIESNRHENIQKVPLLGDIPGIGVLFRSHDNQQSKREILIFVTPTILQS